MFPPSLPSGEGPAALSELQLPACAAARLPEGGVPAGSQSRVVRNKARHEWRRGAGPPAPMGLRGTGRCRGQSGPWRVVRVRRALLPAASRCPPQAAPPPPGDGDAGLSCSAGDVFFGGTGPGRGTGRARGRGTLGKGGTAVRGGRRGRLRSLLLSPAASRSSRQPVAGGLCLCRTKGPGAEPRGLVAAGLSAPPLREPSAWRRRCEAVAVPLLGLPDKDTERRGRPTERSAVPFVKLLFQSCKEEKRAGTWLACLLGPQILDNFLKLSKQLNWFFIKKC